MISRPSFPVLGATMAGLLLLVALTVIPSPSHIWRTIDPLGFAGNRLATATWFVGPLETDTGVLQAPLDSWRVIARAPVADSVFNALAASPAHVPRLYGIAGLALRDSATAARLALRFATETTTVSARLTPCDTRERRSVHELSDSVRLPHFARYLLAGDSVARCSPTGA